MVFWLALAYLVGFPIGGILAIGLVMLCFRLFGWVFQAVFTFILGIWYLIPEWLRRIIFIAVVVILAIKLINFLTYLYNR